jgi:hypothetical protein
MPKNKPMTGPMRTQPIERTSIMPTQMMTRAIGNVTMAPQPKQESSEAVRAKAGMRRNSLRKQREALKG